MSVFDFRIAGDGYVTLSAETAADTRTVITALSVFDFRIAGDGYVTTSEDTAADTCAIPAAGGRNIAAGNGDLTGISHAAANTSTKVSTRGSQTAVLIFVLNGQFAAGAGLVVLQSGMVSAALQLVVAIQLDIGIALADHAHGGFAPAAGVDVHILKLDLYLIILIFGLDGHGVGRSFVLVTICDGGVGVVLDDGRAL